MSDHPKLHLMVISSVRPEPTSGGHIMLHRLIQSLSHIELSVHGYEPRSLSWRSLIRKAVGRIGRCPGCRWLAETFWVYWKARWLDAELPPPPSNQPTVVITVAHGDVCFAAARYATRWQLPLVTFFHDWWPDFPPLPDFAASELNRMFRALHEKSDLSLPCSTQMLQALGPHRNATVLSVVPPTIDDITVTKPAPSPPSPNFKIIYAGNLHEYGPMLAELLRALETHPEVELQVRGSAPQWPVDFIKQMTAQGHYLPFLPSDSAAMRQWVQSSHAQLICQSFESHLARRMATSFPSKIGECCLWGQPLVIWAPHYSSGAQWSENGRKALVITDPDPQVAARAIVCLAGNPPEQKRLAQAARQAAETEFNPQRIYTEFSNRLYALVKQTPSTSA